MFAYDGRQVCALKPQGLMSPEGGVSRQLVSLSSDTLAVAVGGGGSSGVVRCYETAQGRPVGEVLNHSLEVKAVALSQVCVCVCEQ